MATLAPTPRLTPAQAALLQGWSGAMLVIGGPGTGKSTLLAAAAVSELEAGRRPLVLVGNRTAASRLRNRIVAALGTGTWQPAVTTVHALARSLWLRFGPRPELRLLAAPEQEFRVRELLAGTDPSGWPAELRPALGTRGFATQVRAVLARARQLGLDPEEVAELAAAGAGPVWAGVAGFFAEYLDVLDAEGVLDYAELVHRVRLLVADSELRELAAADFDAVLVDDYADLDEAQLGLVESLATGRLLAVADPDSTASSFRGASPRAVADFVERLDRPDRPAQVVRLGEGLRCPQVIDQALVGVRTRLPRLPGTGEAGERPVNEGGEVAVLTCADPAEQVTAIVAELRRGRLEHGWRYDQMAVLVRSGAQLGPIVQGLATAGIPVEAAGQEIPLAQAPAVRPLLVALNAVVRGRLSPDEAMRLATGPLGGLDPVSLRSLLRTWRAAQEAAVVAPPAAQLAQLLNEPGWLAEADQTPAVQAARRLAELLAEVSESVAAGGRVDQLCWRLWQGTPWPSRLAREVAAGGALAARADADLDAVCAFFELAAAGDRRGGAAGVRAFLAELAAQQIPADHERESRPRGRGVPVMTAHRARGQEWPLVILAGVQEGVWPVGRRVSTVLDPAVLDAGGLPVTSHRERLAAERRLFHLACSRASQRLVVMAASGTEGEADAPSRFLAELGVEAGRPDPEPVGLSLTGLVTELRRWTLNPAVTAEERTVAAAELARLARLRDPGGRPLAPAADPATWWGIAELSRPAEPLAAPAVVRLSPSQVGSVLTCARRYFLSRQARADQDPGLPAALGSLVHRLVQQSVEHGWGPDEFAAELDQLWHRLPIEAAWFSATERAEIEAALGRFLAWRSARASELVGVELPFTLSLELPEATVVLDGQVDWLELAPTGARVVDFKTARRAPTKAAVAELEQLGIYQLAINAGGFGDRLPAGVASVGASAVYLRVAERASGQPKELLQPALDDGPTWVHERVAQAAAIVVEGSYPASAGPHCRGCAFAPGCPALIEEPRR
ncbi:superfamily I DNA/RNA helicase [Propionicimonas paludicola]|uniref:DNA 3'-5' helicase n=1 Tax=Propionicimonas paludicola TaxID=185243 RepID=A0A2A9CR23_9ACTN|nr:ATP-dependent DNA helicase [Propionicimonas paludicola]PFG16884.1 superfamily I DNA/RNA helicase [Propionicimonas paludicola]